MEVQKRLQQLIAAMGYKSVKSFEEECGLSNGLAMKLAEKSTERTWKKISDALPIVNVGWLKTGEGKMFNAPPTAPTHHVEQYIGDKSSRNRQVYNSDEVIRFMRHQIDLKDKQIAQLQSQVSTLLNTIAHNTLVG